MRYLEHFRTHFLQGVSLFGPAPQEVLLLKIDKDNWKPIVDDVADNHRRRTIRNLNQCALHRRPYRYISSVLSNEINVTKNVKNEQNKGNERNTPDVRPTPDLSLGAPSPADISRRGARDTRSLSRDGPSQAEKLQSELREKICKTCRRGAKISNLF